MVVNKQKKAVELLVGKYRIALKRLDLALVQLSKKPEKVVDWYENTDKINFLQDQYDKLKEQYNSAVDTINDLNEQLKNRPVIEKTVQSSARIALSEDQADNLGNSFVETKAGFGPQFPTNPQKGDLFLRTDTMPNKLFKWNSAKWIEVARATTDRYAYDEDYIQYIVRKVLAKEYEIEDLPKHEQEEVLKRINNDQKRKI